MRKFTICVLFVVLWGHVLGEESPESSILPDEFTKTENIFQDEVNITGIQEKTQFSEGTEGKLNYTADSLIDTVIDLAIKHIQEKTTGPIKLSDEVKEFNRKFIIIPIKGELVLYNGELNGVNTIHRLGPAAFKVKHALIDVNTSVIFDNLDFLYDFQSNIYKLSTDGICKGNITKLVADVEMSINLAKKELELTRLKLVSAKTLRILINSDKLKDKVINYVLKTVTSVFKSAILSKMEKELHIYVGKHIHFGA